MFLYICPWTLFSVLSWTSCLLHSLILVLFRLFLINMVQVIYLPLSQVYILILFLIMRLIWMHHVNSRSLFWIFLTQMIKDLLSLLNISALGMIHIILSLWIFLIGLIRLIIFLLIILTNTLFCIDLDTLGEEILSWTADSSACSLWQSVH